MQDDAAETPAPSTRRARFYVPVAMLLAGLGLGGAGAWFSGGAGESPGAGEHATAPATEGATDAAATPGEATADGHAAVEGQAAAVSGTVVTSLGTFTVNLRGTGGGRVLRLEVQVEGPALQADAVASRAAPIRDSIITAVSDYTWSELEGAGGKTRLRDELLMRVNSAASPANIERIYFTQFVVQ